MFSGTQITIGNSLSNSTQCVIGFICANETFIAIYGVIFTIIISLGVYIYGLQDKSEKMTLLNKTDIKTIITYGLGFFALTFIDFPNPFYVGINFFFFGYLLLKIFSAFNCVINFNKNELSALTAVRSFKEEVIQEKLSEFEELKKKNDSLTKILLEKDTDGKKIVERFLLDDNDDSYHLIRSQKAGYITNVDLEVLFSNEINKKTSKLKEDFFYIPYTIASGNQIGFDDVILGIKKQEKDTGSDHQIINDDKLRSYISIKEEFDNPQSYLQAEIRSYYPEMFSFITQGNSKGLEIKLEEFSKFVNLLIKKTDSYSEIIQFINDDIILPLQKYAFKNGDIDTIRKITSFSLQYLYESINHKLIQTYNIFLRNLSNAFYESSKIKDVSTKDAFHEIYFRWLTELSKYSIQSKLKKDNSSYTEYASTLLSAINGMLKISFDNEDKDLFSKTLSFLNNSFIRESYEQEKLLILEDIIKTKKAVIFGFTSWVYKYYEQRKDEVFYKTALEQLFLALKKDSFYHYSNIPDELNYYLSIYLKAAEISDKSQFSWDTWGMPEGRVYTITISGDLKDLLIDRLIEINISNPNLKVEIKNKNYNDELSLIKEGSQQFDLFNNKTAQSFYSSTSLTDEQFSLIKTKIYAIFALIAQKYEEDVRINLIEQPLDESKFSNFAKENTESYSKARVMFKIGKFIKDITEKKEGFGYNILLQKEQFVMKTNIHYTNGNQFGEDLARSEDNKILESIYKKFKNIISLKKEEIGQIISKEKDLSCVVLWINNYFNIQDTNQENFIPHWKETNSKQEKGPYYQGSIDGVGIYIVYKFQEHKSYPETLFLFKAESFSVEEFELEIEIPNDEKNIKVLNTEDLSIHLSITNLSDLEGERKKIVEKWIKDGSEQEVNKEIKITELKTNVVFKFFKGINIENIKIDKNKIRVFELK